MTEKKNSWQEWWDSDAHKELVKEHQKSLEKSVGKYYMLSEDEKYDMVQAICYIICEAEKKGTSHRGLMKELALYPTAFWITELMDVHNALWTLYQEETSHNFAENKKDS